MKLLFLNIFLTVNCTFFPERICSGRKECQQAAVLWKAGTHGRKLLLAIFGVFWLTNHFCEQKWFCGEMSLPSVTKNHSMCVRKKSLPSATTKHSTNNICKQKWSHDKPLLLTQKLRKSPKATFNHVSQECGVSCRQCCRLKMDMAGAKVCMSAMFLV